MRLVALILLLAGLAGMVLSALIMFSAETVTATPEPVYIEEIEAGHVGNNPYILLEPHFAQFSKVMPIPEHEGDADLGEQIRGAIYPVFSLAQYREITAGNSSLSHEANNANDSDSSDAASGGVVDAKPESIQDSDAEQSNEDSEADPEEGSPSNKDSVHDDPDSTEEKPAKPAESLAGLTPKLLVYTKSFRNRSNLPTGDFEADRIEGTLEFDARSLSVQEQNLVRKMYPNERVESFMLFRSGEKPVQSSHPRFLLVLSALVCIVGVALGLAQIMRGGPRSLAPQVAQ